MEDKAWHRDKVEDRSAGGGLPILAFSPEPGSSSKLQETEDHVGPDPTSGFLTDHQSTQRPAAIKGSNI